MLLQLNEIHRMPIMRCRIHSASELIPQKNKNMYFFLTESH